MFAYNNTKNATTSYTLFEFNFGYHSCILFEKKIDLCSRSKFVNKLLSELQKFMIICRKNFLYTQKLKKQAYDKDIKFKNYTSNNKAWLNNKYIKIK